MFRGKMKNIANFRVQFIIQSKFKPMVALPNKILNLLTLLYILRGFEKLIFAKIKNKKPTQRSYEKKLK